jgi:hypothetical protein
MEYIVSNEKDSAQRNHSRHAAPGKILVNDIVLLVCQNRERETRAWNIFLHLQYVLQWEF